MSSALVGFGSNLGDPVRQFERAVAQLAQLPEITLDRVASPCWVPAVGGPADQPHFLNSALLVQTGLSPQALCKQLFDLESQGGRVRGEPWGPRTIDLDLLLYDQRVQFDPELTLPHPWMSIRSFVMRPAAEIAAEWVHPLVPATLGQLWGRLRNPDGIVQVWLVEPAALPDRESLAGTAATLAGFEPVALPPEHPPSERIGKLQVDSIELLQSDRTWQESPTAGIPVGERSVRAYVVLDGTAEVPFVPPTPEVNALIRGRMDPHPAPLLRLTRRDVAAGPGRLAAALLALRAIS